MSTVYEILEQLDGMEYGPERVALAQEAVRQADLLGDEEAGFETRREYITAATFSGQTEKAMVAFAWCQDYAARQPELDWRKQYSLTWMHKWMLNGALRFPQIPLSRIYELHDSYARAARHMDAGAASIPYLQMGLAMHLGDYAGAQRAFTVWQWAKKDMLSDCPACEANRQVDYHTFMGDDAAAVKQGRHIIESGMSCGEIPHATYGALLMPLLRLGETELAAEYAARGREMVIGKADFVSTQAEHLEYLTFTDPEAGLDWYARHLPWAEQIRDAGVKMDFHIASAMLFMRLAQQGRETVSLNLPGLGIEQQGGGVYRVSERLDHHQQAATTLAQQFDARNGNSFKAQQMEKKFSSLM